LSHSCATRSGDALGDDLVLLEANVQGLESIAGPGDREHFTQSAVPPESRFRHPQAQNQPRAPSE
jgi:hypothetical protein